MIDQLMIVFGTLVIAVVILRVMATMLRDPLPRPHVNDYVASEVTIRRVYVEWDGNPVVFEANSPIMHHFSCVGMAVNDDDDDVRFVLVHVGDMALAEFRDGKMDLRSLVDRANLGKCWYSCDCIGSRAFNVTACPGRLPREYLPDHGFFITNLSKEA